MNQLLTPEVLIVAATLLAMFLLGLAIMCFGNTDPYGIESDKDSLDTAFQLENKNPDDGRQITGIWYKPSSYAPP